jgi:hypothetical protein
MTVKELEQRVIALEQQVKRLQAERESTSNGQPFDWRASVEKYSGDEGVLAVIREGMKLREKERRAVRRKRQKSRRAAS